MAELAIINGYDIRDRKLADATSKSGVDTSDSIVLKTTSGYANILKRDFTEAIRATLGGILHDEQDKGTSIDKVAAFGTDNNFGSITTANLASVLGVPFSKHYNVTVDKPLLVARVANGHSAFILIDGHSWGVLYFVQRYLSGTTRTPYLIDGNLPSDLSYEWSSANDDFVLKTTTNFDIRYCVLYF